MLIVKHVEKSGHEGITVAEAICFDPTTGREYSKGQVIAFGVPRPISDGFNRYSSGMVHVLSASGDAIAKYDLD